MSSQERAPEATKAPAAAQRPIRDFQPSSCFCRSLAGVLGVPLTACGIRCGDSVSQGQQVVSG